MKRIPKLAGAAALALAFAAGGCTSTQIATAQTDATSAIAKVQTTAAAIEPSLTQACSDAMALVPLASLAGPTGAAVAGYATAGCSDAEKITALAAKPSSAEWVGTLVAQMTGLIPVVATTAS
jgi:hypothetical protein